MTIARFFLAIIVAANAVPVFAAQIALLPQAEDAGPGDVVTLTLTGNDTPEFMGADFEIAYDPSVLTISSADISVTGLMTGWSLQRNLLVLGEIVLSGYGTDPVPNGSSGGLIELDFHVKSDAPGGVTFINFTTSKLDEVPIPFVNGSINVINEVPEPASLVLLGTACAGIVLLGWRRRYTAAP